MAFDPRPRQAVIRVAICAAVVAALGAYLAAPDAAHAALESAAGGKPGSGGFGRFVEFINHLANYTIPIGAAFSVLGLVWGGLLFQAGDSRAGRVLGFVALGVGVILLSKPIAA